MCNRKQLRTRIIHASAMGMVSFDDSVDSPMGNHAFLFDSSAYT